MGVCGRLVHPREKGRAAWRAGWVGGDALGEAHAARGKRVEVRRVSIGGPITTEVMAEVFANEPENVGRPGAGGTGQDQQKQEVFHQSIRYMRSS